jgi:hypothetical protein
MQDLYIIYGSLTVSVVSLLALVTIAIGTTVLQLLVLPPIQAVSAAVGFFL